MCCGYGSLGLTTKGYDCVVIPGAAKATSPYAGVPNQFCGGGGFNTIAAGSTTYVTVCSKFINIKDAHYLKP